MSELPELFESWREHYGGLPEHSHFFPFHFEASKRSFSAAGKMIDATEFDPFTFNCYQLGIEEDGIQTLDELTEHPLFVNYEGRLIGGVRLHDWAQSHRQEIGAVPDLMHAVFVSISDKPDAIPFLKEEAGHRGFRAGVRDDNGGISLQVFGECACLNPSQNGYATDFEGVEKGFAEYELHNTELLAQRVGLYAGLGHAARLASEA